MTAPLILVCDHRGEGTAEMLSPLADSYRLELTSNLRGTLESMERLRPVIVLVDPLASGGTTELDAIDRARSGDPPTPVLVVADAADPLPAVLGLQTLRHGLWDLVHRDAPAEEFRMRIERLVEMIELSHRAVHDDRTELYRPHTFQERLSEHFSAAQRHKLDLALLLIDLDKFGLVNKQHDHTVGDEVIAQVGQTIRRILRREDLAQQEGPARWSKDERPQRKTDVGGRIGGDEFAVVLPYTKKMDAASVVQRLLEEIAALSGEVKGSKGPVAVSASIGFETFDGSDLETLEELRNHAEVALREAKVRGGNQGLYYRGLGS